MELLELTITDLARGGAGVARAGDGRVIFVPLSAPGDRLQVRITKSEKRYAHAEIVKILEHSPQRQTPRCAVFGACGGCQWQHLPYELQWKTKLTGVRQALEKAQVKLSCELEELPAERIWEYRNRIQLNGRKDEIGFFAAGSNALVPIERCEIARPELNEKISALKKEGNALSKPYKVETEVLENGEVRAAWNQGHAAMGFRQIHDEQNQKLRQWVQSAIDGHDGGIFDLFGGDGNLSLSLAQGNPSRPIFCVDHTVPDENEQKRFPSNLQFERASILKWVKKQNCRSGPWATILDPPRVGLADDHAQIAQELERLNVNRVVAVGCDVDSWVRDVRKWSERGWKLARVGVLDLFPQTSHVESLALLLRE